ncbi:hypothetical protein [Poritiphilus flavus]|uniref:Uncharacterized protein n=1 Tax=Poritiphilus flavus TaxID=2697053 RepID=A0A6L9EAE0_9FLAO|nr:hypothetical protein [Poritiphilus flavus]NAS11660.1 hypothetical protein [Poritiphilus flavus]
MKDKEKIQSRVDQTLDVSSQMKEVRISPFFKEKVLRRLNEKAEPETQTLVLAWFRPEYQLAALICIIIVNAYLLLKYSENNYSENLESFAWTYGIEVGEDENYYDWN